MNGDTYDDVFDPDETDFQNLLVSYGGELQQPREELDSPAVELGREQNWVKPEQPGTFRVATGAHTADEASVAGAGSTNSLCPASGVGMLNKNLAMALGALTGLVGLVGMLRLAAGAFSRGMSIFAWVAILSAMVPWVAYVAWRGRHGHLSRRRAGGAVVGSRRVRVGVAVRARPRCCVGLLPCRVRRHLGKRLAAAPLDRRGAVCPHRGTA